MESRVTRLEVHLEHLQDDVRDVKADLKTIIARLNELPTRTDLWQWKWQWTALGFATVAIVIGGIIGGLSWIEPDPVAPTPVQVTLTAPPTALPPSKP